MNSISFLRHGSSLGPLLFRAEAGRLTGLFFADQAHAPADRDERIASVNLETLENTIREVDEYLAGERQEFGVEITAAGTDFQRAVWSEIAGIPYGETASYAEIARRVGSPEAVRAVGSAAGRNPLCLIVPCHRVIGSSGEVTGYAGGLERKRRLLELERAHAFASCTTSGW
jgi:methylated-DNA-[protein]-cysteine S-methyltransferase